MLCLQHSLLLIYDSSFLQISNLGTLRYPNVSTPNPLHQQETLHSQSWTFRPGSLFPVGLQALTFVAPDFNTRDKAPPPCPGHSPIGGCGVMGNANLNVSWLWFNNELEQINSEQDTVFLITHQPFRCRFGVPDWYFCFSKQMKKEFRNAVSSRGLESAFERGSQLSGHQHRWYDGTSFDEWPSFRQFEASAVKGDVFDSKMSSSFALFHVNDGGETTEVTRWWREKQFWKSSHDVAP